jgi:hypothetical protein
MQKLNLWHRLGLVLTAFWIVGSGTYWARELQRCIPDEPWFCDFIVSNASGSSAWFWALPQHLGLWRLGVWGNAVFASFVFPVLVWIVVWGLAQLAKWVWADRSVHS